MAKLISFNEVAKHKCKNNCWLLIHGKVYDVSNFMDEHPGGDNIMLSVTGKDASDDFDEVDHSPTAKEMMKKYYVGDVDKSTVPATKKFDPPWMTAQATATTKDSGNKMLLFLVPLLVIGVAFALRLYKQ